MQINDVILLSVLLGCMATYVPVFLCLFFTATMGFVFFLDMPLALLVQTLFRSLDKFSLLAIVGRMNNENSHCTSFSSNLA